jgi:O-antigen/teichoic acid export membrane protein
MQFSIQYSRVDHRMMSGADNRPSGAAATFRWALLGAFAPKVISPITALALPIFLEPRAFGLMAASTFVLTAVQMVAGMGAGSTVIQRQGDVEETASFAFWVAVTAGTVAFAATWWAAPLVEGGFRFTGLAAVLRVSAISLPLAALAAVPVALLQRRLAFSRLFWVGALAQIAGSAASLTLAVSGAGVWALVLGPLVTVFVQAALAFASAGWRPVAPWRAAMPPGVASFGLWVSASNAVSWSLLHADNAVIGFFLGEETLGIYALGFKLAIVVPGMFTGPVSTVAYPQFARLKARSADAFGAHLLWLHRALAAWVVPASLGVALVAPVVVPAVYGTRWPGLTLVIVVLSVALGPGNIWSITAQAFRGAGFPQAWLKAALPTLLVMVVSMSVAARAGLAWAVVARAAAALLYAALSIHITASLLSLPVREQIRALTPALLPSAGMAIVVAALALIGRASGAVSGQVLAAAMMVVGAMVYARLLRRHSPAVATDALELVGVANGPA